MQDSFVVLTDSILFCYLSYTLVIYLNIRYGLYSSSDADSTVLADYVIALLKHDKAVAALKEDCLAELVDFLANGCDVYFYHT